MSLYEGKPCKRCGGILRRLPSRNCEACNRVRTLNDYRKLSSKERRSKHLRLRYGMTVEEFDAMVADQNGMCAICKTASEKLVVDHCHTHGHVRGLLCKSCNSAIGLLKEDLGNFISAITYLDRTQKATDDQ